MVVDSVIQKAPDGFAGLRRLDAATRTWLEELTLIFERLANDYMMLVFIINCHLEIQIQEHCKHKRRELCSMHHIPTSVIDWCAKLFCL